MMPDSIISAEEDTEPTTPKTVDLFDPRPVVGDRHVLLKNQLARIRALELEVARQRLEFLDLRDQFEAQREFFESRENNVTASIRAVRLEVNALAKEAAVDVGIDPDGSERWILDQDNLTFKRVL